MSTVGLMGLPGADAWGMHGDVGAGWWVAMMIGMALFWGAARSSSCSCGSCATDRTLAATG